MEQADEVGMVAESQLVGYLLDRLVGCEQQQLGTLHLLLIDILHRRHPWLTLEKADEIYLLDFTSIDDKQDGTDIDITYLAQMIPGSHVLPENEEGAKMLAEYKGECLVFMSSKDIYNIAEMVKELLWVPFCCKGIQAIEKFFIMD